MDLEGVGKRAKFFTSFLVVFPSTISQILLRMSSLEQLKSSTRVIADTANFTLLEQYKPFGATTNPSLILQCVNLEENALLVRTAVDYAQRNSPASVVETSLDKLTVLFGCKILQKISGRVSTEVDAKLSFSTEKSVAKARQLIAMYEEEGVSRDRVYIKLAATWEGIQAARVLESDGIACNMTLLFSFAQAVACAQARVSLISPFVGRILDWFKKHEGRESYPANEDPGVLRVTKIYNYFKAHNYETIVMGASFRNTEEIIQLAGCDYLTISPALLKALDGMDKPVPRLLSVQEAKMKADPLIQSFLTQDDFLFLHNEDAMASEKLAEGIRLFNRDARKVEEVIQTFL